MAETIKTVRIVCTSDRKPWTDTRALEKDEEADVPADVAKALIDAGFAKAVKG